VVELPEIEVRRPRGELAQAPAAATSVVDASRFAGESKGVAELLAISPGVDVQRYGASGQRATVAIRGVAADGVKVLLDGLPLGGADGVVDLSTIPRAWIRRLEIVRGPAGAAFGAGALGGAVNVVTGRAGGTSAELSAGSFGTYRMDAQGAFEPGSFSVLAGVTAESTEGNFPYLFDAKPDVAGSPLVRLTARNDASRRGGLLFKLGGPAGANRLDAVAQVSAGYRELPTRFNDDTPSADWQRDGRAVLMTRLSRDLTPSLTVSARVHVRADFLDVYVAGAAPGPTRQRGGAGGGLAELSLVHGRGGLLTGLVSWELEGYRGTAMGGVRARPTVAAALTENLPLGRRIKIGPALRVERVGTFTGLSANLGTSVALAEPLRLRASVGRTLRIPSFTELYLRQGGLEPNPGLLPEKAISGDGALVYEGPVGFLSVGGFAAREDDVITYELVSHDQYKPLNTPSAFMGGVELEAASAPLERAFGLTTSLAYTLLRTEILKGPIDVVGHDLPRRPRHQLFARASLHPGRLELHGEVRWVGAQYENLSNNPGQRVRAATTAGAGCAFVLARAPSLSLHLQVDNLTDRRDLVDGFGNPLPGRSVMVTLRAGSSEPPTP
jgi:iron complex outermembrane receptor protein